MLLVDAHVHVYPCFDVANLLTAAARNFRHAANTFGVEDHYTGVLMLSEAAQHHWFNSVMHGAAYDEWRLDPEGEGVTIKACLDGGNCQDQIYIIAGRQIITKNGLELIALGVVDDIGDGDEIEAAIIEIRRHGGIPVVPWGAGKWLGARGRQLTELIMRERRTDLCLGDNSGRPVFWNSSVHFKLALQNKMNILPGTDPLPFAEQVERVGSFGFMMPVQLRTQTPFQELKNHVCNPEVPKVAYGNPESSLAFFRNQLLLRLRGQKCSG